jgi:hypothetical protein
MISIHQDSAGDPMTFTVMVRAGRGETRHTVTMAGKTYEGLKNGAHTPEEVIDAAFRFLLDREAKESILARFDVSVISRYFPDFTRELPRYFGNARG